MAEVRGLLPTVAPDGVRVVDSDGEVREIGGIRCDRHETRVEAHNRRVRGVRELAARVVEARLCH